MVAFVDREGGKFFQEWSALFVAEDESGGRVCFHYPRLSPTTAIETLIPMTTPPTAGRVKVLQREKEMEIAKPVVPWRCTLHSKRCRTSTKTTARRRCVIGVTFLQPWRRFTRGSNPPALHKTETSITSSTPELDVEPSPNENPNETPDRQSRRPRPSRLYIGHRRLQLATDDSKTQSANGTAAKPGGGRS